MDRLDAIFAPKTIAVIGASTQKGKVGHDIFANILSGGFTGTLYPVNPKAKSVKSVKCYTSIATIPDPIDLGMIILPPKLSLTAVKECIAKGVKGIVIVSAGFKEVGGEGALIEKEIKALCAKANVRLVGPNCLGVINPSPKVSLNASFSARMPNPGNVSFISQSGALCTAVLDYAADKGFGFSKFISIGNKADVDELDLLRYYHNDPDTDVVMIYMEELSRGAEEFISEVREMTSGTHPTHVVAIKSGSSDAGAPLPGGMPCMMPFSACRVFCGVKPSINCLIMPRPLLATSTPQAIKLPLSPMPADRALLQPTRVNNPG